MKNTMRADLSIPFPFSSNMRIFTLLVTIFILRMSELKKVINKDLILRERLAIQRTHLANQSTFLAFLRTSLYLLVAGLSTENLLKLPFDSPFMFLFFGLSVITLLTGIINYFIHRKKAIQSERHIGDYQIAYLEKEKN